MSKILKSRILEHDNFKSGQPGPLSYLIHKLSEKGNYVVSVHDDKTPVMQFSVICDPNESLNSINIDLSRSLPAQNIQQPVKLNSEHGYLLFYHAQEFVDWKIEIKAVGTNRIEFTSVKPSAGDMMAFNLIKPGIYKIQTPANAASDIEVLHPEEIRAQRILRTNGTVPSNRFTHKDFKPGQRRIIQPGQGIVVEFSDEMPAFTLNLKEAKIPKVSFDERLKAELKSKLREIRKDPALAREIKKKFAWHVTKQ